MASKKVLHYRDILNDIKRNNLKNLYLFHGKENYLKENITKKMIEKSIDFPSKDINCKTFYGEKITTNEIIEELQTIPFFSKQKMVIIKRAEKINKINREKLIDYLSHWNNEIEFTRLIIIYEDDKPDKNLVSIVKNKGDVVNFEVTDRRTINMWIKARFKINDKKITEDALYYLKSMTHSNLSQLFNEIEKIDIYTQGKKIVHKEDIFGAIGGSESLNIFNILDDIGEKNLKNAINGIVKLNNSSMHHLSILAMIHRQIKLIFQTKLLNEDNRDFNTIKQRLKLPDFIIEKLIRQTKKYSFKEIFKAYELLTFADLELKNSAKNPSIVLEELVANIISCGKKNSI
jgi:DNA polymerase-3 subunit delta